MRDQWEDQAAKLDPLDAHARQRRLPLLRTALLPRSRPAARRPHARDRLRRGPRGARAGVARVQRRRARCVAHLVRAAHGSDVTPAFTIGDATSLPFAAASFRTVLAYNVLQALPEAGDMASTVREAARVLAPRGHLCLCVAHPMTDVARASIGTGARELVVAGSYFEQQHVDDTVTRDGLEMRFHGWTYTIEAYARAIEDAGLLIDRVREPVPERDLAPFRRDLARWQQVPLFLFVRALKP